MSEIPSVASTSVTTSAPKATAPAPAAPKTAVVSPFATIESDISWIRAHVLAVVLALAVIAGSIIGGIGLFESLIEKHDARVAAAQLKKEGVDTATQSALVAQLNQAQAANATRDAAQMALIQSLITKMSQQNAATAKQVATDASMNAQSAAARLVSQTKAAATDVTVGNDTVTMTLPLTRTVVAQLDLGSQAESDVTNLQGQLAAQKILTTDAQSQLTTANGVIAADKTELVATVKADNAACNVRVDAQAAKDRKRGFWATLGGFIGGVLVGSRL